MQETANRIMDTLPNFHIINVLHESLYMTTTYTTGEFIMKTMKCVSQNIINQCCHVFRIRFYVKHYCKISSKITIAIYSLVSRFLRCIPRTALSVYRLIHRALIGKEISSMIPSYFKIEIFDKFCSWMTLCSIRLIWIFF